jgi:hypothetical protein
VNDTPRIDERLSFLIVATLGLVRAIEFLGRDRATAIDLINEQLSKHRLELHEVRPLMQDVAKP